MIKTLTLAALFLASGNILASDSMSGASATTYVSNASGSVGQTININAHYQYSVTNSTEYWQNYGGFEKIEVDGKVVKIPIAFSLPPRGNKSKSDNATLRYNATRSGKYTIKSTIAIAGTSSAGNSDTATLTVN